MQRRRFLKGATLAGAATALPLSLSLAQAAVQATEPRFLLVRAASADAGTRFEAVDRATCADCATSTVRVRMDGMHVADGASVLRTLSLSALFDAPGVPRAPFLAWHYVAGSVPRMSQRASFVAGRASMRGFELEYRVGEESTCRTEACALTRFDAPLLAPGHYVLAGPRRDGSRVDPATLAHSGDAAAPLAGARDFDYLAFRIEALA
jgi:hypothetical protein